MLPLKDKTVLVTRSEDQAEDFIHQLQQSGAKTLALPLIKTTRIDHTFNNLDDYTWIIFTSANAVRYFFEMVSMETITSKIAVVGEKTSKLITNMGLVVDCMPSEFTAKDLAKELPVKVNDKILIPRSDLAKNDIIELLEQRGCQVDAITIYRNTPIHYTTDELSKIFDQQIDFITFTSGSTVEAFRQLNVPLKQMQIICIGPATANVAQKSGINVDAIASPHTIEGMIHVMTGQ